MPARSVCLVTLSLSEAGPGRFGRQVSVTDIYHTIPYQFSTPRSKYTQISVTDIYMYHTSVPVPPIILLTDMVPRCRLLAAHGLRSCLSARTQPLTATGAPSQTSTIPYHTIP